MEVLWSEGATLDLTWGDSTSVVEEVRRARGRVEGVDATRLTLRISRLWRTGNGVAFRDPRPTTTFTVGEATVRVIAQRPETINQGFVRGSTGTVLAALLLVLLLAVGGGFT